MLSLNIIGAGRLGKTLGKLFVQHKIGNVQAICNQTIHSSISAIDFIGAGIPYDTIEALPESDITLIATPDHQIEHIATLLSRSKTIHSESLVFHCSGALSSQVLTALKTRRCSIASVHPMHSFADPARSLKRFKGTYCAIEGDRAACDCLSPAFEQLGGITYPIETKKKTAYHAGAVMASNYLVTICQEASKLLEESGVEPALSIPIIASIMRGTVENLSETQSTALALTGPIQRGDAETIAQHMRHLTNKKQKELYRILGLHTLNIAKLPKLIEEQIKITLNNDSI